MKKLIVVLIAVFATNAYADRIACTTRFVNVRTDKDPSKYKICGAVSVQRAFDNGVKYRMQPRSCKEFNVEFFSIRKGDDPKFTSYCDTISAKNCYLVRISDTTEHQGLVGFSSHMVFPGIAAVPAAFSLNASAMGHHSGPMVGLGRIVRMDLRCRKYR